MTEVLSAGLYKNSIALCIFKALGGDGVQGVRGMLPQFLPLEFHHMGRHKGFTVMG